MLGIFSAKFQSDSTVSFLKNHNICLLDWPENSPYANSIENLWHIIKSKINTLRPLNAEEMWSVLKLFAIFLFNKNDLQAVKYICVINNM